MEIVEIEVNSDRKIVACELPKGDGYHVYIDAPKTMRFLGDTYEKTGWSGDKMLIYYTHARSS